MRLLIKRLLWIIVGLRIRKSEVYAATITPIILTSTIEHTMTTIRTPVTLAIITMAIITMDPRWNSLSRCSPLYSFLVGWSLSLWLAALLKYALDTSTRTEWQSYSARTSPKTTSAGRECQDTKERTPCTEMRDKMESLEMEISTWWRLWRFKRRLPLWLKCKQWLIKCFNQVWLTQSTEEYPQASLLIIKSCQVSQQQATQLTTAKAILLRVQQPCQSQQIPATKWGLISSTHTNSPF